VLVVSRKGRKKMITNNYSRPLSFGDLYLNLDAVKKVYGDGNKPGLSGIELQQAEKRMEMIDQNTKKGEPKDFFAKTYSDDTFSGKLIDSAEFSKLIGTDNQEGQENSL
jgi:hypothetical protein